MSVGAGDPRGVRPLLARYALMHRQLVMESATLGLVVSLLVGITAVWWRSNAGLPLDEPPTETGRAAAPVEGEAATSDRPATARPTALDDPRSRPEPGHHSESDAVGVTSPVVAVLPTANPTKPATKREEPPIPDGTPASSTDSGATTPRVRPDGGSDLPSSPVVLPAGDAPITVEPGPSPINHAGGAPRPRPVPTDRTRIRASAPSPQGPSPAQPSSTPKEKVRTGLVAERVLVTGSDGSPLVARVERKAGDRSLVTLPDGSLGWVSRAIPTELPFEPWGLPELRKARASGVFGEFDAVESQHYFVLTEGSVAYARQCATQLEDLYRGLIDAFRDGKFDVHAPEVPLVVVIFRDRESMMVHRRVDPSVRAYYEAYSNQIILHETSAHDERTPDLAALRRPQSVAHEGVHQLLQNIGVQPRLSEWPAWLVEGLAEFFAPATVQPANARERFGAVNPFHMATLIDLNDPMEMWARLSLAPSDSPAASDGKLVRWQLGGWIEHVVTRDELGPTDYAMAWALTHHLAKRRPEQLRHYVQQLARDRSLEPASAGDRLQQFRLAFHADTAALAAEVDAHLRGLEYAPLPYFALPVEIDFGGGYPFRGVLVSQSQVMIQQWLGELDARWGVALRWGRAVPYPSRKQALQASEGWRNSSAYSGPWPGAGPPAWP